MPCDRQQGQARQGANMSRKRVANKPKTTVRHETMRGQSHSLFCSLLCSPAPRPCRTSLPELFSRLFSSVRCQPLHISCCSPFNKHLWSRSIDISPSPSRRGLFSFPRSTQLQIIPPAFQHVAFDTRAAHQVLPPTTHIAPDCKPLDPFRLWYHEPTSPGSFRSLASHVSSLCYAAFHLLLYKVQPVPDTC